MDAPRDLWLVTNSASGSCSEASVAALLAALDEGGMRPARTIDFPAEPLPTIAALDQAGVGRVAIFTGDGTINSTLSRLCGWGGDVLVLPGGTKNLLAISLHGEAAAEEIVAKVAAGAARRVRPPVVHSARGEALAGALVGPGTAWADVREAIRETDVVAAAAHAVEAIGESTAGPAIACIDPPVGREGGYSLLNISPSNKGLLVEGYYAETIADYARQGLALLRFNFRDGPHDDLGVFPSLRVASSDGSAVGLLLDGEQVDSGPEESFRAARCSTELLATAGD